MHAQSASLSEKVMSKHALLGPTKLLASGRIGREVGVNRSDRPVFVDADGHICCEHGERAATIQSWINAERENPEATVCRPSVCNCANLDGLLTSYDVPCDERPASNGSLFKLVGWLGAAEIKANTRPQRFVLTTYEGNDIWVQPSGTIVCEHGNSKKALNKLNTCKNVRFRSKSIVKCNCRSLSIPRRVGSVFVQKKSLIKV